MNAISYNKKAVVTLTTFSLIVIIAILMVIFSYFYYNYSKTEVISNNSEIELTLSLISFRSELVNLVVYNNSNMTYLNSLDSNVLIYLQSGTLRGVIETSVDNFEVNVSSLGIEFCSEYNFSPVVNTSFNFNGSCVTKLG